MTQNSVNYVQGFIVVNFWGSHYSRDYQTSDSDQLSRIPLTFIFQKQPHGNRNLKGKPTKDPVKLGVDLNGGASESGSTLDR
jgi:hypothetical protein